MEYTECILHVKRRWVLEIQERETPGCGCVPHTQSYVGALTLIEMVFEGRNYGRQFETEYILMEEPDSLRRLKDPPPQSVLCLHILSASLPSSPSFPPVPLPVSVLKDTRTQHC